MKTVPSIYQIQYIPQYTGRLHPRVIKSIEKKGKLANQEVKRPYKEGCDIGGECLSCTYRPCGKQIDCNECSVKKCDLELPCVGWSNHVRGGN